MLKIIKRKGREKGAEENKAHGGYNTLDIDWKLVGEELKNIGEKITEKTKQFYEWGKSQDFSLNYGNLLNHSSLNYLQIK